MFPSTNGENGKNIVNNCGAAKISFVTLIWELIIISLVKLRKHIVSFKEQPL